MNVQEYAVAQTSLEQIFQTFATERSKAKSTILTFKVNAQKQLVLDNSNPYSTSLIGVGKFEEGGSLLMGSK